MSGNSFLVLCYKCLTDITDTNNGFVVSCGDFVCGKCIAENSNKTDCPACGKSNVRFADLRSSLPEEIRLKTSDPSKHLESAHTSLIFQVKYYKKIIKKLIEKNERLQLCCNEINSLKSSNQKDSHRNSNFFDYGADEPTLPIQNLIKQR